MIDYLAIEALRTAHAEEDNAYTVWLVGDQLQAWNTGHSPDPSTGAVLVYMGTYEMTQRIAKGARAGQPLVDPEAERTVDLARARHLSIRASDCNAQLAVLNVNDAVAVAREAREAVRAKCAGEIALKHAAFVAEVDRADQLQTKLAALSPELERIERARAEAFASAIHYRGLLDETETKLKNLVAAVENYRDLEGMADWTKVLDAVKAAK